MQAALVSLAQAGDADAAITLIVQLKPGLVRLCRLVAATSGLSGNEVADEVRGVFFEALYRHPLESRPVKIAANLLLDTRRCLVRANHRERAANRRGPRVAEAHRRIDPSSEDIHYQSSVLAYETLRAVAGRLPGSMESRRLTVDIAFRAWVLDQASTAIAAELGLGPQAVASRLHRLRRAIQQDDSFALISD